MRLFLPVCFFVFPDKLKTCVYQKYTYSLETYPEKGEKSTIREYEIEKKEREKERERNEKERFSREMRVTRTISSNVVFFTWQLGKSS